MEQLAEIAKALHQVTGRRFGLALQALERRLHALDLLSGAGLEAGEVRVGELESAIGLEAGRACAEAEP